MPSRVRRSPTDVPNTPALEQPARVNVRLRTVGVVTLLTPCCEYARGRLWTLTPSQYMAVMIKHTILCVILNMLLRVDDLPPHMRVLGAFDHVLLATTRLRREWWRVGLLMAASALVALRFRV